MARLRSAAILVLWVAGGAFGVLTYVDPVHAVPAVVAGAVLVLLVRARPAARSREPASRRLRARRDHDLPGARTGRAGRILDGLRAP